MGKGASALGTSAPSSLHLEGSNWPGKVGKLRGSRLELLPDCGDKVAEWLRFFNSISTLPWKVSAVFTHAPQA